MAILSSSPICRLLYRPALPLVVLISASTVTPASASAQDARAFVHAVVTNEVAADANDHSRWIYRDDNRVPEAHTVKLVIQTSQGDLSKTIEKDGNSLSPQEQKEDEQKIDAFANDASVREKQKHDHVQDAEKAGALTKLLGEAFLWTIAGQKGAETTLHFKPDPKFEPPTHEARVFAAMEGVMVVNTEQKRIRQLKGAADAECGFWIWAAGQA